jgi:hypothetical protein
MPCADAVIGSSITATAAMPANLQIELVFILLSPLLWAGSTFIDLQLHKI